MTSGTAISYSAAQPVRTHNRWLPCGEDEALAAVLAEGNLSASHPTVPAYQKRLASYFGADHAIAVNSGTSALHAALHVLGAGRGREVIVPATAPPVTAMPILTCGATPVIVDTVAGPGSTATWTFPLPSTPALAGFELFNQGASLDTGPTFLAFSNGGRAVLGL